MKKHVKKTMALGMAGILLLAGCGMKDGGNTADLLEEPVEMTPGTGEGIGEADAGAPEFEQAVPEPVDGAESEETADTAAEEEQTAGMGSSSGAADAAEDYADETSVYDTQESLQGTYERTGGTADEWKMAGTPVTDLYAEKEGAPDGYLGSCYDFTEDELFCSDNQEEYSRWQEKGFSSVMAQPLSTFSADVDTASYSNLRRLIREGYDLESLPEGAVRIEEMLNYFSYDFKEPMGQEPFGVTTELGPCPWNQEAEVLMVGLKTEDIRYDRAPASNLVFLLDVSGSMDEPDKLPLLQESFVRLAGNLTEKDRISIVTYAAEDRIVLQGAHGNERGKIEKALNGLEAGGGTNGGRGIETAYRLAEENFIKGGNNRVILATDGDLNIGMTTEEELEELITDKKESGIFLSVLGFGTGNIKDNKMETLADKGNGNYAYIDCLREAQKVLSEEMTATLLTVCKDVKIQVEFNPEVVEAYRLLGYENRALDSKDFHDDTKDGGEIGAGHSVTALYEIVLREPLTHDMTEKEIDDLKYSGEYRKRAGGTPSASHKYKEWLTISIRYKKPAGHVSTLLEYPVGYDSYRTESSGDFRFSAAVAEFGLLAAHSRYPENASLEHVKETLKKLDIKDSYKIEFLELVEEVE